MLQVGIFQQQVLRACGPSACQPDWCVAYGKNGLGKVLVTPHLHNFLLGLRMEPCIDEMKRSCCCHASSQHLPHPAPFLVPRLGHLRNQRPCVITFNPGIGTSDQKQPGGLHRPTCDGLGSVLTEQTRGPARPWRVRSARTASFRQTTRRLPSPTVLFLTKDFRTWVHTTSVTSAGGNKPYL